MAIFASECRSSNGVSFYLLFTTFYDFLCGAKFWNTFLSLIWRERDFINMPIYNLTSSHCGPKKKASQRRTATEFRKVTKTEKLLWYHLRFRRPIRSTVLLSRCLEVLFHSIFVFWHLWRWNWVSITKKRIFAGRIA